MGIPSVQDFEDNDILVEVVFGPDDNGKSLFYAYWISEYHPGHPDGENRRAVRGQTFRAVLQDYKDRWRREGKKVGILKERS